MNFKKSLGYTIIAGFILALIAALICLLGTGPALILMGASTAGGFLFVFGITLITDN